MTPPTAGRSIFGRKAPAHVCVACEQPVRSFKPFRNGSAGRSPVMAALEVVGSDIDNFYCPHCGGFDRERHLRMYFDALNLWEGISGGRVLHIAPERHFSQGIADRGPAEYVRGDLNPDGPEKRRLDVTDLPFEDDHFDVIICNHVLEHVPDDGAAMRELRRVLSPNGFGVLQTPYSPVLLETFEDDGIQSDDKRLVLFGQEDHVRCYGLDLFTRLEAAGFQVERTPHADLFPEGSALVNGVNGAEDLILVR